MIIILGASQGHGHKARYEEGSGEEEERRKFRREVGCVGRIVAEADAIR